MGLRVASIEKVAPLWANTVPVFEKEENSSQQEARIIAY